MSVGDYLLQIHDRERGRQESDRDALLAHIQALEEALREARDLLNRSSIETAISCIDAALAGKE